MTTDKERFAWRKWLEDNIGNPASPGLIPNAVADEINLFFDHSLTPYQQAFRGLATASGGPVDGLYPAESRLNKGLREVNSEQEKWLKAILWKLATDNDGKLEFGELTLDIESDNGILVEWADGMVTVHAIPDFVQTGVDAPEPPTGELVMEVDGHSVGFDPAYEGEALQFPHQADTDAFKGLRDVLRTARPVRPQGSKIMGHNGNLYYREDSGKLVEIAAKTEWKLDLVRHDGK